MIEYIRELLVTALNPVIYRFSIRCCGLWSHSLLTILFQIMYPESGKRHHVNMAQFERICTQHKLRTSVKQIIPSQVSTRMAASTKVIVAVLFMTVVTSVTVGRLHGKLNILVLLITIFPDLLFQGHVTGSSVNSILSPMLPCFFILLEGVIMRVFKNAVLWNDLSAETKQACH